MNNGVFNVLDGFSMYLASVVIFRVFFAILYVIKWQWRFAFNSKYKIGEYNIEKIGRAHV